MASINKVILVGHVGQDPAISHLPSGRKVAKFSLATSETWKDKNSGDYKSLTEWHTVKVLNPHLADIVEKYIHKGSKVYVDGKIMSHKWTSKDGSEKVSFEIVLTQYKGELTLLDSKKDEQPRDEYNVHDPKNEKDLSRYGVAQPTQKPTDYDPTKYKELEDEIPF